MAAATGNGTQLSALQIAQVARGAGFSGDGLVTAVAVALEESRGWSAIVNTNSDRYRSRDRGLWQINDHYHPDVSDADAFNPPAAARAAYAISAGGTDWQAWSAVKSGAVLAFMPQAAAAAVAVDARSSSSANATGTQQLTSSSSSSGTLVDTYAGPWPAEAVCWALLRTGLSDADVTYALAAAYDANGKRDGFYLPQGIPAVKHSLWPAITGQQLAYIGAHDGTVITSGATPLAAGRLTGEGWIGHAAVTKLGRAAVGSPASSSLTWAATILDNVKKNGGAGWSPLDPSTIPEKGAVPGLGPLPNPLSGIEAVGAAIASISNFLTNVETWKRLGLILAGALVAAFGVHLVTSSTRGGGGGGGGHRVAKAAAVAAL